MIGLKESSQMAWNGEGLNEKFGVKYSKTNIYRLLHSLNF